MNWSVLRDQIGYALTGVESYEHRKARMSNDDLIAELRETITTAYNDVRRPEAYIEACVDIEAIIDRYDQGGADE